MLEGVGSKYFFVQIGGSIDGVKLIPINSNIVDLSVNAFPEITISSNPKDLNATINQATNLRTFSVGVNPIQDAQLNYQWYSTNTTGSNKDWHLINGATSATYTVSVSDLNTVGTKHYYVKISGNLKRIKLGSINSNVATLRVNTVPTIVIQSQPINQTVMPRTTNLPTFSVGINPIQGAQLNYQWFWSNPKGSWNQIDGANSSSYTVNASDVLTPGSTKRYYVRISGTISGSKLQFVNSNTATLEVNALPEIKINQQPQKRTYYLNKSGQTTPAFSVGVNPIQDAKFTYQWYSNTTNSTNNGTAIAGAISPSLTIPANDLKNAGTKYYYVKVGGTLNGLNLAVINSNVTTLTIGAFPTITINK